jgi:LmbE family N-acetylglucosaminyl deacetylase
MIFQEEAGGARPARRKVLAIGAHPDDIEVGCGGALAKHRARDDSVMILLLSRGSSGGDPLARIEEGRGAANLLGAAIELCDIADTRIPEDGATIAAIQKAVLTFRPTHVYTHSLHDTHQDHRNAHRATIVAARETPNIYCYQSPSSTLDFRPNYFIDISSHIERKLALIAFHQSQTSKRANLDRDLIVATARFWGRYAGYCLAEPMEIIRQVD